jgi:hypothetical protein
MLEVNKIFPGTPTFYFLFILSTPPSYILSYTKIVKTNPQEKKGFSQAPLFIAFLIPFRYIQGVLSLSLLYSIVNKNYSHK